MLQGYVGVLLDIYIYIYTHTWPGTRSTTILSFWLFQLDDGNPKSFDEKMVVEAKIHLKLIGQS